MTQEDLQELCVVDLYTMQIYDFTTAEDAPAKIAEAEAGRREHLPFWRKQAATGEEFAAQVVKKYENADFQAMTFGEFLKREREKILSDPMTEITEEKYNEMLDVLPPLAWCTRNGIEEFCMEEFYTGSYTSQYAHDKSTGKYYTKIVDYRDKTTWIDALLHAPA